MLVNCPYPFQVGLGDKVDLEDPRLTVTSHSNGDFVRGTVTLRGAYSDDLSVASIKVSFDGGMSFVATKLDSEKKLWSYTFDTRQQSDGEKELIVQIADEAEKIIEKRLLIFVDNEPPLALANVPQFYASNEYNGDIRIKGEATDRFGVALIQVEVLDASDVQVLGPQDALGTNSWSFDFKSKDHLPAGTADYKFVVTAFDNSGNRNTYFYHYDDIYAAISPDKVTVEQLLQIDLGDTVSGISLTQADLLPMRLQEMVLTINQNRDLPDFIISNPDEDALPSENILGSNAKALGMVTDDDGVDPDPLTIEISIDDGAWVPVTTVAGSGLSVRWEHDLSALGGGAHYLKLRAQDLYGTQNESQKVFFSIDLGAPTVDVTSPAQGSYQNGTFLIQGTATDSEGVASVEVSTNGGVDYYPATDTGGGFSTWSYTAVVPGDGLFDGSRTIKVMATDTSAKVGYVNLQVVIDTEDPNLSFLIPQNSASVNGEVLIKGTASDNTQVTQVELKIGKSDPWITLPGTYNWEYTIDSVSYANSTHSDETPPASDVWKLNVQARATDASGNIATITDYYIFIDNDLDKPTVTIISPSEGQNIGGSLLVSGTAFDDDAVDHVEMQLDLNADGDFLDQIDLNGDLDTFDKFEDESTWYSVDGTTLWTQDLNTAGELYETELGHTGDITIRVRAVDTKDGINPDIAGNYVELNVHFDDTIPRVENLSHSSGDYVKGNFSLTGDVLDDEEIASINVSYDGGVSYTDITASPTDVTQNALNDYDLHIPVDTTAYIPTSGILYLRLKVIDNANYQKLNYINLNVDNVYPDGTYTGDASDIRGASLFSRVQGTATDTGAVSGIEEIHVYFVRAGNFHNPQTGGSTAVVTTDFGDGNGLVPYPASDTYKIIIDNPLELGNDAGGNGDGDGYDESLTVAGSTYNWWAEFDSTNISDGVIDIHYVVFDNAGNGHHYTQSGFIKNNKPVINDVVVGSDVDMSGTVEADEQFSYAGLFTVRNRLYIDIDATDNLGGLVYQVYHDPSGANTLVLSAATGTIDISAYAEGATDFLCRVTDSDGIIVETTLLATIENTDTVDPVIALDAMTQGSVVDGHIELDAESLYNGPDPDISGTITVSGTTSDNQRISSISITIDSFDAGSGIGVEHTVATWSGGTLVSSDGSFSVDTQDLSEASGHQVSWSYTWDTSGVTNSARKDTSVLLKVTDFATPTQRTATGTKAYDIVPYVSAISTQLGGIKNENIRAVSGKYSVKQNLVDASDTIVVSGYNLRPITGGVRVSTDADGLVGTVLQGAQLTVESMGSPWTQLTLRKDSDRSGYINVVTGSVADPIPSVNNINDNTRTYNQEPDIYSKNFLLTDDRYFDFYAVTETGYDNGYYPAMIMNGDTPVFAYNDDNTGQTMRDGTIIGRGWYHRMNALAVDIDDNYYQVSIHDAFGNGRYGHMNLFYNGFNDNAYPATNPGSTADGNNALALDNLTLTFVKLNRYHYPKMIVDGDTTTAQVYLLYYDDEASTQDLIFRTFQIGTTCIGEVTNLAGTIDSNQVEAAGDGTAAGRNVVAGSASLSFDMGLTSTGVIVVVYYDEAVNSLRLIYNTAPVNGGTGLYGGSFSAPLTLDTAYNGTYVSMTVDTADHIHIAYYDSANADLKYIYLDSYTDTVPDVARVDAYHSVGLWTDVAVSAAGTPYIAYYNNSENGTVDSIKLTYYTGILPTVLDGVDGSDNITGDWESLTVPVTDVPRGGLPQFNQVSLGFDTADNPVIGYLADDIEYSVFLAEIP
jgi:hypothetical protein